MAFGTILNIKIYYFATSFVTLYKCGIAKFKFNKSKAKALLRR